MFDYIRDPAAIYQQSVATVSKEADLSGLSANEADVAVRLIHACGMPDITGDLEFSEGAVAAGRAALKSGATILADVEMVHHGIIRARLPAANKIICTLHDDGVREAAKAQSTTRSAAAVDQWGDTMSGAVVAIGNAPTALYRVLELIEGGAPKPTMIAAFPVGFVGASESKDALIAHAPRLGIPFITLTGRRGGSALAAACINALSDFGAGAA
jgi:precorrin-8X/cobalt-precorrin-8 methylmutase